MYSSDELFKRSRESYFGVDKYQNNTRVSAETVRHESTYIILFLTRHNDEKMTIKMTIFTHRPRASLAGFALCWWRHNRLLMTSQLPDNCDAITWIVISNSLDIDFIHGDIHGRWCRKIYNPKILVKYYLRIKIDYLSVYPQREDTVFQIAEKTRYSVCVISYIWCNKIEGFGINL